MTSRLTRSASPLLRRLLSSSSISSSSSPSSTAATPEMACPSLGTGFRRLATMTSPAGGRVTHQPKPGGGGVSGLKAQRLPTGKEKVEGVRAMSGGGGADGGEDKDKPKMNEFSEEEWDKVMGRGGYVKRPAAIHDYDEPDDYTGRSQKYGEYSVADNETLLTSLRQYEPHPIGPWSWTPPEDIRPFEMVRQHGPTCPCEMCRNARENFQQAAYLTKTEVMEKSELMDNPAKFHHPTYPGIAEKKKGGGRTTSSAGRNIWEENLPTPPWFDESHSPAYRKEMTLLYNRDHPWLKGPRKPTNNNAKAGGGAVTGGDSPSWLDSSYPPAYAKEIRRLYNKQKAQSSGKTERL